LEVEVEVEEGVPGARVSFVFETQEEAAGREREGKMTSGNGERLGRGRARKG
jgi:hypothetical protein